jgi:replicative DNA helicase
MGLPLLLKKLTTIVRGQRRGCLFMESAPSGVGKSRRGNAEACHLAVPEYYDTMTQQWVHTGFHQKVLVISTELEQYECQLMWMAFISGVSETHIKDGRYAPGEEERVDKAISLINDADFYFVGITNYDADDIAAIIKKYHQLYDVSYVYFDYLGETLKLTSSLSRRTKVQEIRTDQILLMFSSILKDLAKTLNIFIWTASQLSGNYKDDDILDAAYLRSAKSLADKVDCGLIIVPVRPKDQPVIDAYAQKQFKILPNFVMHIYKVRAGSYQNIRLYFYFDRSTCGVYDCFVVNQKGEFLNVEDTDVELLLDDTKEGEGGDNTEDVDF